VCAAHSLVNHKQLLCNFGQNPRPAVLLPLE